MRETQLQTELALTKVNAERITNLARKNPELISSIFDGLSNDSARVKFACSKALVLISETHPGLLRSDLKRIFRLLSSQNHILKWNAIAMLGNIAAADELSSIGPALRRLYRFMTGGELIAANHAIAALGKIGRAAPGERQRITLRLLGIGHAPFETDECRNIAIGKCIQAMGMIFSAECVPEEVLEFARRQRGNRRRSTAEKAKTFLRKFGEA
jgi:hypothetical protein